MQEILNVLNGAVGVDSWEASVIVTMTIMMLLAGICAVVFHAIKLPPIVGYLIAGILIMNVPGFINNPNFSEDAVLIMKNLGLIMLMFGIGTELSLEKIKKTGKFAILVAVIQLPLMVLSGYVFGIMIFGLETVAAITLGAIISGSSTAVVAAVLKTQKRISAEDAETLILVTIMEDIGQVIILSMVTPLFVGGNMDSVEMSILIIKIVAFMVLSTILGVKVIPHILNWIGDKTSKEILLVFSIGLCFGMALLSTAVGLSMAIGAFLMGMMVSQSKFSEHIHERVEPMKEVFMAVFFISVGMEVSTNAFINSLPIAIGIFSIFMISKFVTVFLGYFVGGKNFEISFVSSISLMAMGEFAFIIASEAYNNNVVSEGFYSAVIGASILSMIALPLISSKMFAVVDRVHASPPPVGVRIYSMRDDIKAKMDSSPSFNQILEKKLKRTYFCILLIIIIEIVFSAASKPIANFVSEIIDKMFDVTNSVYVVNLGIILVNFAVLVIPTYSLIASIKKISNTLIDEPSPDCSEEEMKKKMYYRRISSFSTVALIFAIDFILMAIVPGPFGTAGSMIAIPIAILIFILAFYLSGRKAKKNQGC